MENYKPALLKWMEEMFEHASKKQWYETYHGFDVHGVISKPDYRKTEVIGQEFEINYYPFAKETLQFITKNRPDMILFLFTSSYPGEIKKYLDQFEKDGIFFKFVNENPDISDTKGSFGCYDKKPYFNSLWEDKAGFNPLTDWEPIYNYFVNSDYKPDPNWSFKSDEDYHEKTIIKDVEIKKIKVVLDMGLQIESPHYRLNTTNWGDGKTKFEYALTGDNRVDEYFYDNGDDDSYKEAIEIILNDQKKFE